MRRFGTLTPAILLGPAVAALLAGGAAPVLGQDARALDVLEGASRRYLSLAGFCADFRQVIDVTLLRDRVESEGELCQLRPDRFEMRWSEPAGDRVVADGSSLWVYFPNTDEGQAFRTPLDRSGARFDLHREFLEDPGARYEATYEGTEVIDGRENHMLLLLPKEPSPYLRARIWVDDETDLIRRLELLEESESIRTLDLTNTRLDPSLPADRFDFEAPPGVQVITR